MAVVYWIHAPHHTDMFSEGYIGVTVRTTQQRFATHKSLALNGGDLPIHRAIRKYSELLKISVVIDASEEYCYSVEEKLRPRPGIGYNSAIGGAIAPMTGRQHSEESRKKMRDSSPRLKGEDSPNFGRKMSEEQRQKKSEMFSGEGNPNFGKKHPEERIKVMSELKMGENNPMFGKKLTDEAKKKISERSKKMWETLDQKAWQNPKANIEVWVMAEALYEKYWSVGGCGFKKLNTLVGRIFPSYNLETIVNMFKSGWNPAKDTDWVSFKSEVINGKE